LIRKNIAEDDLDFPNGGRVIRIVPVIIGSKRAGALQTILGAALVVVGAIGAFTPIGQAFGGAAWGPAAMKVGAALMVGGVAQMLSPQPTGLSANRMLITGPLMHSAASRTLRHRDTRFRCFTVSTGLVELLFLREFTSKIRCEI